MVRVKSLHSDHTDLFMRVVRAGSALAARHSGIWAHDILLMSPMRIVWPTPKLDYVCLFVSKTLRESCFSIFKAQSFHAKNSVQKQRNLLSVFKGRSVRDRQEGHKLWFLSDSGHIYSPRYPKTYPVDTKCLITFKGSGNKRVQIIFEEFNLAYSGSGPYENVGQRNERCVVGFTTQLRCYLVFFQRSTTMVVVAIFLIGIFHVITWTSAY